MPEKNKGNSISNQSKLWMENFQEITIQEITDHARVSRRTFYRNYSSKEEILEGRFNKIWLEYRMIILQQKDLSLPNIARVLFTQIQKYHDFLSLLNRQQLLPTLLAKIHELLPPAFSEVKGETIPFSVESIQYAMAFSAGGFTRILILWLNDKIQKSPDEMAALVEDFFAIYNYPNLTNQ
jgi:AcrR family transcriptional regulator